MNVLLASLPFYPLVSFLLLIVFGKKLDDNFIINKVKYIVIPIGIRTIAPVMK